MPSLNLYSLYSSLRVNGIESKLISQFNKIIKARQSPSFPWQEPSSLLISTLIRLEILVRDRLSIARLVLRLSLGLISAWGACINSRCDWLRVALVIAGKCRFVLGASAAVSRGLVASVRERIFIRGSWVLVFDILELVMDVLKSRNRRMISPNVEAPVSELKLASWTCLFDLRFQTIMVMWMVR